MSVPSEKILLQYIKNILNSPNPEDVLSYLFQQMAERPKMMETFIDIMQKNKELIKIEVIHYEPLETKQSTAIVPDEPPSSKGRRVVRQERLNGSILRREYVPCGSTRCRKRPDEHGPYWYSYRYIDGKWVVRYHGNSKPSLLPVLSLGEAKTIVYRIAKLAIIEENDIHELRRIVGSFVYDSDKESTALRDLALSLIERERIRRENLLRERHHSLFSKAESEQKLTQKEQEELDSAVDLLASEH